MPRGGRRISTSALPGICSASIGFMSFFAGILIVCVTAASKEDYSRELTIAGPCCIAAGTVLILAGFTYKYFLTKWKKQRKREEEAARLQQLITSVIVPYRNDMSRKYEAHGYTVYDSGGLIIGLNGLPHRGSMANSSQSSRHASTSSDKTVELPDIYIPGLYIDSTVDLNELKNAI